MFLAATAEAQTVIYDKGDYGPSNSGYAWAYQGQYWLEISASALSDGFGFSSLVYTMFTDSASSPASAYSLEFYSDQGNPLDTVFGSSITAPWNDGYGARRDVTFNLVGLNIGVEAGHAVYALIVSSDSTAYVVVARDWGSGVTVTSAPGLSASILLGDGSGEIEFILNTAGNFAPVGYPLMVLYSDVVPEPSTYGMILGGLALAGAALRRRQKAAK